MGRVRRLNPLSWRIGTVNLVFGGMIAVLLALLFVLSVPSFAAVPPIALLSIPGADLSNAEIISAPPDGRILPTPERQIGLYQPNENLAFLYGHSTTIFTDLPKVKLGDEIAFYDIETETHMTYEVTDIVVLKNSDVNMGALLAEPKKKTLILMTCAGNYDEAIQTYDARLIITANPPPGAI